jgi:hypothetical protein
MKPLTTAQLKAIATRWLKNNDTLTKTTASATKSMDEIQKQVANDLSTVKKRNEFCMFMTYQFKIDKKVNSNLQTCINKPNTQRYILKVAKDKPLTQKMSIRTPSKELLSPNHKLDGKAIITQAGIDKGKGVYACFKWDIPKAKKPTQISKTQAVVNEFSITEAQYDANKSKIKFATVD